jgi:hypothetical protein
VVRRLVREPGLVVGHCDNTFLLFHVDETAVLWFDGSQSAYAGKS